MTTNRLSLSAFGLEHSSFILDLVNTKGWLQFIGDRNIHSIEDAEAYISKILANAAVQYWVVTLKDNQTPIGVITFIKRDYLTNHDIGFAFLPEYMGKGYAYEATNAVLQSITTNYTGTNILASTIPSNVSSIQLLQKLGLQYSHEIMEGRELLHIYTVSVDELKINALTATFFSLFSNIEGKKPELNSLYDICLPEAIITHKTKETNSVYTLATFIAPRQILLTDGSLLSFEEKEISGTTNIIGTIAQRQSKYAKKGLLNGLYFEQQGNKFFQFVKTDNDWKIAAIIWEDEA